MKSPSIGELNGVWSVLLRIGLGMQIPLIMWVAWVTVEIVTIGATRFTLTDGVVQRDKMTSFITAHANGANHPPQKWVVDSIERLNAHHP